jgi:hypothetical protein
MYVITKIRPMLLFRTLNITREAKARTNLVLKDLEVNIISQKFSKMAN